MGYFDRWNRRLSQAREKHKEGKPVWYRRDSFVDPEFTPDTGAPGPRWHVFADRQPYSGGTYTTKEGSYTWKALCGYKHTFREQYLDLPTLRLSGRPKIADQCINCRNRLAKQELALSVQRDTTKVGTMSEQPTFTGTPDDWWEQAEEIMESEASNRELGNWYITQIRTAGDTRPGYRLSTPSKPPNTDNLIKARGPQDTVSLRVRLLVRGVAEVPAWMTSIMVVADTVVGDEITRLPWMRKKSGRWQSLYDGRLNINDHAMAELNPNPATISEDLI